MPYKDIEKRREWKQEWRKKNPEKRAANRRRWKNKNPDLVKASKARGRTKLKRNIFEYYGGTPPICACCGEDLFEFLTIDHINGDGAAHRRELGTDAIYAWLKREGYPEGFRVLCINCNFAMGLYGYCPHQQEKEKNNAEGVLQEL